ncbi:MAG: hypothetical protein ABIO05_08800 [Ferruginibacter sp.]
MKIFTSLFVGLLLVGSYTASAQTADEIMAKHIEAMGGKEKMDALKSVRMTGNMTAQGTDIALVLSKQHEVGMRMDLDIMGSANYQVVNNKTGWGFFPVMGMTEAKEMEADQYKGAVSQLDVQGALYNAEAKGNKVDYEGIVKVDGADAYKLDVKYKNGNKATYFIDVKTNRHVKTIIKAKMNGTDSEMETTFSDFKQNANGYWFPYTITNSQGTISFDNIETNVTLAPTLFDN